MKKITAIIQPVKFDALKEKLIEAGICGLTILNVEGYGFQESKLKAVKSKDIKDLSIELLPKIQLEIAARDDEVEKIVETIISSIRTGRIGDGKIFISDLSGVIRIRTGERNEDALQ